MASRYFTTPPVKITTTEILEILKQAHQQGDSTSFFYLLVAIGGKGDRIQESSQLIPGQPTSDRDHTTDSDRDSSDSEDNDEQMETADHVDTTTNTSQLKKRRKAAINEVRNTTLPDVLRIDGWKKVYDKDRKSTYPALYFKKIERQPSETEIRHNQRVGEIRVRIREKVEDVQERHGVRFKINTLLSRAILYDDQTFS